MKHAVSAMTINDVEKIVNVEADDIAYGDDSVWFERDKPPGYNATWKNEGYCIQQFLSIQEYTKIIDSITLGIARTLAKQGIDTTGFTLANYHNYVNDEQHLNLIDYIRAGSEGTGGLHFSKLPIMLEIIEKRISEICNTPVTAIKTFLMESGSFFTTKHFWVRIIRPQKYNDNNLPHKDVHIERGGAEGKKAVNLYLPLAGSNEKSSLPILPNSHLWSENEIERTCGSVYSNGVKYTNPAVVSTKRGLNLITPNPGPNEVMVFTPYIIHGGGFNFNADVTRVSLEMRFWHP
jgi:ectoine hydroxylase-related dioxygenase (phytanoyl-CoA dioxygenase family)